MLATNTLSKERISIAFSYAILLLITPCTLLPPLFRDNWLVGLLPHLRPHYLLALFPVVLLLLIYHRWVGSTIAGLLMLIHVWPLVPYLVPTEQTSIHTSLSISHFNIDATEPSHAESLQALNNHHTDILLLQEVTHWHLPDIENGLTNYQLIHAHSMSNTHGSALFVHQANSLQFTQTEIIHLPASASRPLLTTQFQMNETTFHLLSLHVTRPRNQRTYASQQIELESVAEWSQQIQSNGEGVIIIGDFNTTPWSSHFTSLIEQGNLLNAQVGYGLHGTWPSFLPSPLRIPIDHLLHSPHLVAIDHQAYLFPQSDHLLLKVSLSISD